MLKDPHSTLVWNTQYFREIPVWWDDYKCWAEYTDGSESGDFHAQIFIENESYLLDENPALWDENYDEDIYAEV